MKLLLLAPATSIQSLYSTTSRSSISTSITITPNKFKFNYIRAAADSSANSNQHQPNLLHLDYNGTTTSSSDANTLNFDTNSLSLNNVDDDDASPRVKTERRRTINRSSILAKQVIAIHSANTLGFVSQLWLDPTSWLVLLLELRPNLLSGQAQRFLLHHVHQVGDVVLVQDETVIENEISMVGLETLPDCWGDRCVLQRKRVIYASQKFKQSLLALSVHGLLLPHLFFFYVVYRLIMVAHASIDARGD